MKGENTLIRRAQTKRFRFASGFLGFVLVACMPARTEALPSAGI